MGMTLRDIAKVVGGHLLRQADGEVWIEGVARLSHAGPTDLTVVYDRASLLWAEDSPAGALLLPETLETPSKPAIRVANPRLAWALALEAFQPPVPIHPGIHPTAVVAEDVELGKEVAIGPGVVIESGTRIGHRTVIQALCYVGQGVQLGEEVRLFPRVTLYDGVQLGDRVVVHSGAVIGSDGFGYVLDQGRHRKIPQLGTVRIGPDVEIGANTTIDRATTGATEIGAGTKIDNLVQIAHNVVIGKHCIITGQCGIAGSCHIGDGVMLGGQVGVKDHVTIGAGAMIGAQAGVIKDVPAGAFFSGYPARPHQEQMRAYASLRRLPELWQTVQDLEKRLAQLQASLLGEGADGETS